MLTDTQKDMFNGAFNATNSHLTLYGMRVHKQEKPYTQIVISDGKGNQLILRAV